MESCADHAGYENWEEMQAELWGLREWELSPNVEGQLTSD